MKLIVADTYEEMSRLAADEIAAVIEAKPDCVLGLATGTTPIGLYADLVSAMRRATSASPSASRSTSTSTAAWRAPIPRATATSCSRTSLTT